jgi:hypothetical protein
MSMFDLKIIIIIIIIIVYFRSHGMVAEDSGKDKVTKCASVEVNKRKVKHVRARMIPSYYRARMEGYGTRGCQDRTKGLFSPGIRDFIQKMSFCPQPSME